MHTLPNGKANLQTRAVGRELRAWREQTDLSWGDVARAAGWSACKMSQLQNALYLASDTEVITVAIVCNVDAKRRELACRAVERARNPEMWDRLTGNSVPYIGWTPAQLDSEASRFRIVATELLPHVVRTADYAGALKTAQASILRDRLHPYDDELREATQTRLQGRSAPRLHLLLSPAVLRRQVGGARVMTAQLLWLLKLAEMKHVTFQIVPEGEGTHAGTGQPFTSLSFYEQHFDDVVYIELPHTTVWLEAAEQRSPYEETFDRLLEVALSPEDSLERIADAVEVLHLSAA